MDEFSLFIQFQDINVAYCLPGVQSLKFLKECSINSSQKNKWKRIPISEDIRVDFKGAQLNVSMLPFSFNYIMKEANNMSEVVGGVDYEMLVVLSQKLNFRYQLFIPEDKFWGHHSNNGTWTGLIGTIQSKVWISMITAYILIGIILLCTIKIEACFQENPLPEADTIYWYLFALLIDQGIKSPRTNIASSLLIISWLIVSMIITAMYSGTLASFMSVPGFHRPIETMEELYKAVLKGNMKAGTIIDTEIYYRFKDANTGMMKTIGESISRKNSSVSNITEALDRVLEENYAFITPDYLFNIHLTDEPERFFMSPNSIYNMPIGIAFPEKYPYRRAFDKIIFQLVESGLINKWMDQHLEIKRKHWKFLPQCKRINLLLQDVQAAFYLLLLGYGISTCFLLLEIAQHKFLK